MQSLSYILFHTGQIMIATAAITGLIGIVFNRCISLKTTEWIVFRLLLLGMAIILGAGGAFLLGPLGAICAFVLGAGIFFLTERYEHKFGVL
jgi:hypothetical protein